MPSISRQASGGKPGEKAKLLLGENEKDDVEKTYGATEERSGKASKKTESPSEKKPETKPQSTRQLFRYANGWDLCLLLLGTLVSIVTGAGWPFISMIFGGMTNNFMAAQNSYSTFGENMTAADMQQMLDSMPTSIPPELQTTKQQFMDKVIQSSLQYTYLGCTLLVSACIQMSCWLTSCERQIHKIRKKFFESILRQDIAWFDEHQSGEMTTKLNDNLERMREGMGDKCGLLLQYIAQFFAGFIIAFIYSWKLALVMMSLTPLLAGAGAFMSRLIASSTKREQEKYSVAGAIAEEVLSCIRTVISFNGQQQESERYKNALDEGKRDGIMKSLYTGCGLGTTFLIIFCSYALAFWYGSTLILANEIPRGTVFTVFFSVMLGSFALGNAAPQISTVAIARGAATAIYDIIDRVPDIDPYSPSGKQLNNPKGRVEFTDVKFNYPTRKDVRVLDGMSFTVEPGQTIALCGPSGCGKSTVINLILRYYDADTGKITIDGQPITDLNVRALRNLIGVVSQEPVLFEATIEENIKFGNPAVSPQEMVRAAKMANAHDFITKLPQGYNTRCGEGGTQLSGGQKQRVAIARALVRDPKILLLDEATSALDAESEGIVQEALDKAAEGRTTIIIAHRLSTIRNADQILAVEQGKVVEAGTHADLMTAKSLYYNLVTAQLFEDATSGYGSAADPTSEAKDDDEDSGTDISGHPKARKYSRRRSQQSRSKQSGSGSEIGSVLSYSSLGERRTSRLLSKVDTEKERLKTELEEEGVEKSNFLEIARENKPEWGYLATAIVASAVRGVVMPAFAFIYGQIFEVYSKQGDELREGSIFWSLMFIVIGVVNAVAVVTSVRKGIIHKSRDTK